MKLANDTITVFNARVDPEIGGNTYIPTVISGVSWYCTQAETVDPKGGLVSANRYTVRIPLGAQTSKAYADPVMYRALDDVSGVYTLTGGTIIIRGAETGTDWTPAALKAAFADCFTVLGVTDNRRAPNAPHFRVVGT